VKVVAALVEEPAYDNFKGKPLDYQGRTACDRRLHDVWNVRRRYQRNCG